MKGDLRINKKIRAKEVRCIDEKGEQLGVLATEDALKMAAERGLDLVEVASEATPPVCRFIDYGKKKYESKKKLQKSRKKAFVIKQKELRLRPITEDHDVQVRIKHARVIIEKGHKVMFSMFFRGREIIHMERGMALMKRVEEEMSDVAKAEGPVKREGSRLFLILVKK